MIFESDPPCRKYYQGTLLPLIQSDPEIIEELKEILVREFDGQHVLRLTTYEFKRFNGRVITVLRQRGLMQPPFGERAA